ncbi:hypothetical protein FH972_023534 [Carpinus fangiana]|uniref:Phosphatidate cytidylyltransferase, mitochondrial n=1 Tax=Carpinus fangiana TaxID=176857 RepID=A0A5N6KVX9_9ROSI|nr:hypothetical protein FH972_023534 [Carpinus fangiana]
MTILRPFVSHTVLNRLTIRSLPCQSTRFVQSAAAGQAFFAGQLIWHRRPETLRVRHYSTSPPSSQSSSRAPSTTTDSLQPGPDDQAAKVAEAQHEGDLSMPPGWEESANRNISSFNELPHKEFGFNQHMIVNAEFKEALRQVLWQFRAPIRYAFAYGSGVFPQSKKAATNPPPSPHPHPPEAVTQWQANGGKTIDFIFGVSYTQHWHSLNLQQHRDHYSFLGSFGSGLVSRVQDNIGAGTYFNPYIIVNGIMIKYGVVNLDTIYRDLSQWDTMYIAGRLQKPVKILRDDPRIRLGNQANLISALRAALLMLPEQFTERELYNKIAGLSYMGDLRMTFNAEDPKKVSNIVDAQMSNFRQLYYPLIEELPNVVYNDPKAATRDWMSSPDANCQMQQDMDPTKRGNMVRRLPPTFQSRLYNSYRRLFTGSQEDWTSLMSRANSEDPFSVRLASDFDKAIATQERLDKQVAVVVRRTIAWPTATQSMKSMLTAGFRKGWHYLMEKRKKGRKIKQQAKEAKKEEKEKAKAD